MVVTLVIVVVTLMMVMVTLMMAMVTLIMVMVRRLAIMMVVILIVVLIVSVFVVVSMVSVLPVRVWMTMRTVIPQGACYAEYQESGGRPVCGHRLGEQVAADRQSIS